MVQKHHFDDGEPLKISSKRLKQVVEHTNQIVSFSESVFPEDPLQYHHASGDEIPKNDTESDEKHSSGVFSEPHGSNDDFVDTSMPGCISFSSGTNNLTSEEASQSKSPLHYSISSEFFNPVHHQRRILTCCEEIYSLLLDHPPQKSVSIGPDHQADIPPLRLRATQIMSDDLYAHRPETKSDSVVDEYEERLIGTCVIPMPEVESFNCHWKEVGRGRAACSCGDSGIVGCAGKHIAEAREELEKTIGSDKLVELGLSEMGEQVSQKWSEEEERLFYEVVFSNPASLGKNFWRDLSSVFASKSKKELVSYYYNVFMLRRRAEQNRCDSLNIDSDNDEWQGTDDYGDNELGMSEEEEDSVVESPLHEDEPGFDHGRGDGLQEYDEDIAGETYNDHKNMGTGNCFNNCSSCPTIKLQDKIPCEEREEHEVQDDSCTSSDTGTATQETPAKTKHCDQWLSSFTGPNSGVGLGHESVQEHCDAKVWDVGYVTCSKSEVDFLPTSSMIEEVFGDDSCSYKARDGKSLS